MPMGDPRYEMKPRILLTLLFAIGSTWGHAEDPERLKLLRGSYQRELERVTVPVNRKYLDALNQLVASYTQAGELDAALAVREEIKSVLSVTASKDNDSKESGLLGFKDWLETVKFLANNGEEFTVNGEKMAVKHPNGNMVNYDIRVDSEKRIFSWNWTPNEPPAYAEIAEDRKSGRSFTKDGKPKFELKVMPRLP